jgi:hypothetical protein
MSKALAEYAIGNFAAMNRNVLRRLDADAHSTT